MLVAEKKHRIKSHIYGEGAEYIVTILRQSLPDLVVIEDENELEEDGEELIPIESSDWYKQMEVKMTPGKVLRSRREYKDMTQAELSDMTGIPVPNISLMEADKRGIGLRTAKKLGEALGCSFSCFCR